jgi:hypothetical protein
MTRQLRLIETPHRSWKLDRRTREIGRKGIADARAALAAAHRPPEVDLDAA